jgi:branched-chain amino acid transport system substrate-binding protein
MANSTARAIIRNGGTSWYFLTADYAFGHQIERDVSEVVKAQGGTIAGTSRHPFNAGDFSSFALSAQASKAKIVGLANGGADTINSIKAARDFGLVDGGQRLAGLSVFITDIHGVGLPLAQDLLLTEAFYWDLDEATRNWSRRYFQRMKKMPTAIQAANYSSTMHYLKAVQAAGTDGADAVIEKMKATRIDDFFARGGTIRPDGRMVHEMYLVRVKKPSESKYPWDYYQVLARIPGDEAFQPLSRSACPLVRKG